MLAVPEHGCDLAGATGLPWNAGGLGVSARSMSGF